MVAAIRALRDVWSERPVRVVSSAMMLLLVVTMAVGAAVAAKAEGLAPATRETVLWLIGVAGFGGSLLGAAASAIATITMLKMQGANHQVAINEMRAESRAMRDAVASISREVSDLRGYMRGQRE